MWGDVTEPDGGGRQPDALRSLRPATMPVRVAARRRTRYSVVRWVARWATIVILISAGFGFSARALVEAGVARTGASPSPTEGAPSGAGAGGPAAVTGALPGASRFNPTRPALVLDTRRLGALNAGAEVFVPLPGTAADTTAVLMEVSLLAATGPGDVTVDGGAGPLTALRVPKAKAQTTATVVVRTVPGRPLHLRTAAGGHLLVNLVGTFQRAKAAAGGRIVAVPPTRVLRLVPATAGKRAAIRLSNVPVLRRAGSISAVLLQVAGDVGKRGGYVAVGSSPGRLDQTVFWSATTGTDRTRGGLLIVPVRSGAIHLRYEAGTEMRVALAGYVTGPNAAVTDAGLVVPVPPRAVGPLRIPAGAGREIALVPPTGFAGVPPDRVAATLLGVTATGEALGGLSVRAPGAAVPPGPTMVAPPKAKRSALALVGTAAGTVRVISGSGASVTLTPHLLVITSATAA